MDPNAALNELRELAANQLVGVDCDPYRLAELAEGLDGWLSQGGFLPRDWNVNRRETS